ncbi:MAG: hypothetical protein PGN13_07135 [Patulibacter minatonensis]
MNLPALLLCSSAAFLGVDLLHATEARAVIAFRSATCGQTSNLQTLTLNRPAGAVADDVLVASIGFTKGVTNTAPAGWTQVPGMKGIVSGDQELISWYRVVQPSGEPSSYTFSSSSSTTDTIAGGIAAYSGVDTAAPIAGTPAQTIQSSLTTTDTLPNSNGSAVGSMRISSIVSDDMTTTTYQSPMTKYCDETNETGVDIATSMAYESTGIGTTATRTVSRTDNAHSVLQTFVLAPLPCSTGGLNLSEPSTISFGSTALNGTDRSLSTSATFGVDDQTGTKNGWNLSATSSQFLTGGTPMNGSVTVNGVGLAAGAGRCTAPTSSIGYPMALPHGSPAPTAAKIFNAVAASGRGPTNLTFNFTLGIPASARIGTYTSTWTVTLATGP